MVFGGFVVGGGSGALSASLSSGAGLALTIFSYSILDGRMGGWNPVNPHLET